MATVLNNQDQLKDAFKAAIVEVLQERKDLIRDIIEEILQRDPLLRPAHSSPAGSGADILGRYFTTHDDQQSARVAVISEQLAARYWPNQSPLGRRLRHVLTENVRVVDTVAALRLLTPDGYQDDELVLLNGYLTRGDGVQFLVKWDSASTAADNGY